MEIAVEELPWFPFASFQEFRDACRNGRCYLTVDRSAALSWAESGKYTTSGSRLAVKTLARFSILAVVAFIVYSAASKSWLLLLALPLFAAAYALFHPVMRYDAAPIRSAGWFRSIRLIRAGSICLSLLSFAWGVLTGSPGLVAVTGVMLVIWLSHEVVDRHTLRSLGRAVTEHEDILCSAWWHRDFAIHFPDGRSERVDSQLDNAALFPDVACEQFDEMFPKALEGDKRALAQLSWVLSAQYTSDFLKTHDRDALRQRYVFTVSGKFPYEIEAENDDDVDDDDGETED